MRSTSTQIEKSNKKTNNNKNNNNNRFSNSSTSLSNPRVKMKMNISKTIKILKKKNNSNNKRKSNSKAWNILKRSLLWLKTNNIWHLRNMKSNNNIWHHQNMKSNLQWLILLSLILNNSKNIVNWIMMTKSSTNWCIHHVHIRTTTNLIFPSYIHTNIYFLFL